MQEPEINYDPNDTEKQNINIIKQWDENPAMHQLTIIKTTKAHGTRKLQSSYQGIPIKMTRSTDKKCIKNVNRMMQET